MRTQTVAVFTVLASLFGMSPCQAEPAYGTGDYFRGFCRPQSAPLAADDSVKNITCAGIISGVLTTGVYLSSVNQPLFCAPMDTTVAGAAEVLENYLRDNPERGDRPIGFLSIRAFVKAWPCAGAVAVDRIGTTIAP